MWRKDRTPPRTPHPDPLTELRLQRIIGLQQAITRHERLVEEHLAQMRAARAEQNDAGDALRESGSTRRREDFETDMAAQERRIQTATAGILAAEEFIAARREEIAKLSAEMNASELAYL